MAHGNIDETVAAWQHQHRRQIMTAWRGVISISSISGVAK